MPGSSVSPNSPSPDALAAVVIYQVKLAELQDLVMRLVAERNDWYNRYTGAITGVGAVSPDLLPAGGDHTQPEHQAQAHPERNAGGAGICPDL